MAKVCRRSGKWNYRSPGAARAALKRIAQNRAETFIRYDKVEVDFYKCPYCPYWHLTHLRQRGRKEA